MEAMEGSGWARGPWEGLQKQTSCVGNICGLSDGEEAFGQAINWETASGLFPCK